MLICTRVFHFRFAVAGDGLTTGWYERSSLSLDAEEQSRGLQLISSRSGKLNSDPLEAGWKNNLPGHLTARGGLAKAERGAKV